MSKIVKGGSTYTALALGAILSSQSGSYTPIGDISLVGARKPILVNAQWNLWSVEIPVFENDTDNEPVEWLKLVGNKPDNIINPEAIRLSVCMRDKPYKITRNNIVEKEGVTKAGKPRWTFVNEATLMIAESVLVEANALMLAFAESEGLVKPKTPAAV